jgi:D-aminopeptidase
MIEIPRPRLRDFSIHPGKMEPGQWNAITDVPGVRVGQVTLIENEAPSSGGSSRRTRTGVTVILPHEGNLFLEKTPAAVHTFNGFGKATGFEQVRELGVIETPIALTNTLNVGRVWDAVVSWMIQNLQESEELSSINPIVGECNDGHLNDIQARRVHAEHVFQALDTAATGPVKEGVIGAGTGMICYDFKGGVGTASRLVKGYCVGVLVVTNFGECEQLMIQGVPVGTHLRNCQNLARNEDGSVMIVIATNAPLSDRQLGRIARRAGSGLARTGSTMGHSSGDFAIAFSTANKIPYQTHAATYQVECLVETELNPFFDAVVEATEEAVLNSLFTAETVEGQSGHICQALPLDQVVEIMHQYGYPEVKYPAQP